MRPLRRWYVALAVFVSPATTLHAGAQDSTRARLKADRVAGPVHLISGAVDQIVASAGPDGLLLVDTGYPETVAPLRDVLAGLGTPTPRIVITTHWHHGFANAAFGSSATIIAHRSVAARMGRTNTMYTRPVPPFPEPARPIVLFDDSLRLRFNGEDITLLHLPSAHTDGDIAVFFHKSRVVATGDVFVNNAPLTDYPTGGTLAGLLRALDVLLARIPPDAKIVTGHGRVSTYRDLVAFRDVGLGLMRHADTAIRGGKSAAQFEAEEIPTMWRAWLGGLPGAFIMRNYYDGVKSDTSLLIRTLLRGSVDGCLFLNGRWYDGQRFVAGARRVVAGQLRVERGKPAARGCMIDLHGRHVVPPYADAHRHDLSNDTTRSLEEAKLLAHGVFYAMIQDPIAEMPRDRLASARVRGGVDAVYTQGVITPSWGVIPDLYRMLASSGRFGRGVQLPELDGRLLFLIDTPADLARKWPAIRAKNTQFLKVMIAFSEEFSRRHRDPRYAAVLPGYSAKTGLDPALLPQLVERAHASGLRVSAHVETAADFRLAVRSGVDIVAHMPAAWQVGPRLAFADSTSVEPWLLTDADAALASARGTWVITTLGKAADDPQLASYATIYRHNLRLLESRGVRIALGSDGAEEGIPGEIRFIASLGAVDNAAILRAAARTARLIYPTRALGQLGDGADASFLVLDGDPVADIRAIDRIVLRVKDGRALP